MAILSGVVDTVKGTIKNIFGLKPEKFEPGGSFKTKDDVISYVKNEFERRQKERKPKELQWLLNQNYLNGNQYCDINVFMQEVQQIEKAYEWEERKVFNQIAPIFETRLAKLKKNRPIPFTIPATQESTDINTAKTTTSILKGIDKDQSMPEKRAQATAWAEICGCAFYKRTWNPKAGRIIGELDGEPVYEGKEIIDLVSPFEIFPDSNFANGIEGCRSIIHARAYHKDVIEELWPKDVNGEPVEITGRKVDIFTLSQTNVGTGGLGYIASVYNFVQTTVENHEVVMEYMVLPCKKFPEGLIAIVVADKLLHYGPYIYRVGEDGGFGFSLTMQVCVEMPGFFWPATVIERLIPIQQAYNAVKNKKHETLNRIAIGVLAVQDNGNIDTEDLEREGLCPGKILTYGPGESPPQFLRNYATNAPFSEEEKKLEEQFYMISGVSPFASQSIPPTGVVSGTAMEQIREADDSRISLTADNINTAAIKGWKVDVRLNKQFAKGPRLLRYVGENNEVELIDWQASDLTSDDIIIDNVDELSQTPGQRMQIIKELLQYKLFSNDVDPKIRNKVIEMMQLGNWESADDIEDLHINKAKRENKGIIEGKMPVFKDYDMHELHLQEHNRLRLDVTYEEFEQNNPELARIFDEHCVQHKQAVEQQTAIIAEQMSQKKPPTQNIPYKDLPASGKIQMLEQAGIEVTPEDVVQQMEYEMALKHKNDQRQAV